MAFKRGRAMLGDGQPPALTYRVLDVAFLLSVSPSTVYRLVRRGELPAVRRGRHIRVVRTDLDAWLERKLRESEVRGWFASRRPIRVLSGGRDDGAVDEAG